MPMSEMTGLQRRIETLEDDLRAALSRLARLEAKLADEDAKVCRLERAVQHEHEVIDRLEMSGFSGMYTWTFSNPA